MLNTNQRARPGYPDTEFFVEFACQGIGNRFACLDLAAGKFPKPTLIDVHRATRQEHFATPVLYDSYGNMQHGFGTNGWRTLS